jgi:uncharacterized protein YndB with AHSA1/START domain
MMTEPEAPTRSLVIERELPHPPAKVWRALTEGALLETWLLKNDFQPVVGHRFNFRTKPMPQWNGVIDGEVLEVEPCSRLSYTWIPSGGDPVTGPKWVVTWTLAPTANGVLVRMEQSGFRPEDEAAYQGASFGWKRFFDGLERVVGSFD